MLDIEEVAKKRLLFLLFDRGNGVSKEVSIVKKGILILGDENDLRMKLLEQQLSKQMNLRPYPTEEEMIWGSAEARPGGTLTFRKNKQTRILSTDWIYYLEKQKRKVIIHFEKREPMAFYGSLEEALDQLGKNFCHCHKSYVVNLDKVDEMREESFHLSNGNMVPIGQRRRPEVQFYFERYELQKNIEKQRFFESFSCFEM